MWHLNLTEFMTRIPWQPHIHTTRLAPWTAFDGTRLHLVVEAVASLAALHDHRAVPPVIRDGCVRQPVSNRHPDSCNHVFIVMHLL